MELPHQGLGSGKTAVDEAGAAGECADGREPPVQECLNVRLLMVTNEKPYS